MREVEAALHRAVACLVSPDRQQDRRRDTEALLNLGGERPELAVHPPPSGNARRGVVTRKVRRERRKAGLAGRGRVAAIERDHPLARLQAGEDRADRPLVNALGAGLGRDQLQIGVERQVLRADRRRRQGQGRCGGEGGQTRAESHIAILARLVSPGNAPPGALRRAEGMPRRFGLSL